MIAQLVAGGALVAVALVVAGVLRRRRPAGPTQAASFELPVQLDPADVDSPLERTLVLFSASDCDSCAGVRSLALAATGPDVGFLEVEYRSRPDLHRRYRVEAVPMLLVVDREGVVRQGAIGPQTEAGVRQLVTRSFTDA